MNREILFRGKRTDNGEWVEGYYTELPVGSLGATIFSNDDEIVCENTASYIIKVFTKQHSNYSSSNPLEVIGCEQYEIIPDTDGQYTGLTDKNGNKIFEGDIVIYQTDNDDCPFPNKDTRKRVGRIFFSEFRASYSVTAGRNGSNNMNNDLFKYVRNGNRVEVIGNIHDNPELLEVDNG